MTLIQGSQFCDSKAFTVELMVTYIGPTDMFVATTWSLFASGVLYVNHRHIESSVGTSFINTCQVDAVPSVRYRPGAMSAPTTKNPLPGIGSTGSAPDGDTNAIAATGATSPADARDSRVRGILSHHLGADLVGSVCPSAFERGYSFTLGSSPKTFTSADLPFSACGPRSTSHACPAHRVASAAKPKSFDQAIGPNEQSFMAMTPAVQHHMLVDSLRLVAAPPEAQVAALPDFVCLTCELTSLYTDAYLLVPQLEEANLVTGDGSAALRRLDAFFREMPEDVECFDGRSLPTHWFWAEARRRAADAFGRAR